MRFADVVPSPVPGASIFSSVIAEEALALSAAFLAQDVEEMRFRTTLLLTYALDTGQSSLTAAASTLLKQVSEGTTVGQHLADAFEQVIAAAADGLAA